MWGEYQEQYNEGVGLKFYQSVAFWRTGSPGACKPLGALERCLCSPSGPERGPSSLLNPPTPPQELESLQSLHRGALIDAEARLHETLASQRADHEAGLARHLGFIDR